jgi:hypothetical protein
MDRSTEISELRRQFTVATTNYVSAVSNTENISTSWHGRITPSHVAEWDEARQREQRMLELYNAAKQKLSLALASAQE